MSKKEIHIEEENRRLGSKNGSWRGGRDDSNVSRQDIVEMDFYAEISDVVKALSQEGLVCTLKCRDQADEVTFQLNRDGAFFVGKSM